MAKKSTPPLNVGDEGHVKRLTQAEKLKRLREVEELRVLLDTYGGRAFVWRLLEYCGVYHAAPGSSSDMARFEGRRDVGLWVVKECFTSDPGSYTLMRREAEDRDVGEE